ncbi:mCG146822 [Mus musculus]|nr:mCG146822 [Mus musculus]
MERAAESRIIPNASPVAQAIEALRAPRMHLGQADEDERGRPTEPRPPPRPRRSRCASGD